jgi:uncharacterized repeat protein (TIGR02059 family)
LPWGVLVDIPRTVPSALTYRNNSLTFAAFGNYALRSGDDSYLSSHNNLDNAVITGNKFEWTGYSTYPTSLLHGIMAGYNINYNIKYNYQNGTPYAAVIKSGHEGVSMTWTSGSYSYNINKNTKSVLIKAVNGVRIYNNTFYNTRDNISYLYQIDIANNHDPDQTKPYPLSSGTKIKNNIFYVKYDNPVIHLDTGCTTDFECDYNVYYSEQGINHEPIFSIGSNTYTWAQWQALGFDSHSRILNPNFIDIINFVPTTKLDFGTDLDSEFKDGLAVDAVWGSGDPAMAAQNGTWQVGARVYKGSVTPLIPVYLSSAIKNPTPSTLEMTYSITLANVIPTASAFTVQVNAVARTVNSVTVSGTKVSLNLASPIVFGDVVTISYNVPSVNPIQTLDGGQAAPISTQPVSNNVPTTNSPEYEKLAVKIYPNPAKESFTLRIDEPTLIPDFVQIIDFSGTVLLHEKLDPDLKEFIIPINIKKGTYIVRLDSGKLMVFSQKLIVSG